MKVTTTRKRAAMVASGRNPVDLPSEKLRTKSGSRYYVGMAMASCFSLMYFVAPFYIISAGLALFMQYPSLPIAFLYSVPLLVSAILPPIAMPGLLKLLTPMLDYFAYEEVLETKPVDVVQEILNNGRKYVLCKGCGSLVLV
jgi:hypothetical protein